MATKTVVCPECGSPVAPGRYACADCGSLLAAVGPAPRRRRPARVAASADDLALGDVDEAATEAGAVDDSVPAEEPFVVEAAPLPTPADAPLPATAALSAEPVVEDRLEAPFELDDPFEDASGPFDENAPLAAAVRSTWHPDVLHDVPEAPAETAAPLEPAPLEPEPYAGRVPLAAHVPMAPEVAAATALPTASAPTWPPPGDRGPLPAPEPRTLAGAYLPPSAVLPPLDNASAAGAMALPAVPQALHGAPASAQTGSSWSARASAALTDALSSVRVTADAARGTVAVGAGIAALGTLLPWVNTLPGASPLANYLDRWGLAGPGVWLILIGLVVLATIAGWSGRTASWPVGLPAVIGAAFLAGLIWPYAVGGFGRSIGIWIVVIGAVVLFVGGLFARRARHERGDATV
jgi:hypothetical protein